MEINKIVPRKGGSVIIYCNNADNINVLKSTIAEKIGNNYTTMSPRKINPKIVIYGVSVLDIKDREEFSKNLLTQNKLDRTSATVLNIVRVIGKEPTVNVIIEVDPFLFKSIMQKGKLFIGWKRCQVRESYHILRCYKCSGFGHLAKNCRSPTSCPKCAGDHALQDCSSADPKCVNCVRSNDKYQTNYSVNHSVFDKTCPIYQNNVKHAQNITNYELA
ncbi:hypothetical protein QE152_g31016 [Popillia japonica]|uniref:CCHC-type domain-containing protein n=1 Tax=Popillia japonica TaxID=7064 RepID=A0AAW1JCV3_POPJA